MTTLIQAAQQALDALLALHADGARAGWHLHPKWEAQMRVASDSITALRTALRTALQSAQASEPVGEIKWAANIPNSIKEAVFYDLMPAIGTKLYTHPAPGVPTVPADELRRLRAEVERLRKLVPDVELAREAIYAKAEGREA